MNSWLPETRWSLILAARTRDETRHRLMFGNLYEAYWKPVYCYFRQCGYQNETAKDLTQDFFFKSFEKQVQKADRELGSFRDLLLTTLRRCDINVKRDKKRKKRAPAGGIISLVGGEEGDIDLPGWEASGEEAFTYRWIVDLLDYVLAQTEKQCCDDGLKVYWQIFYGRVLAPIREGAEAIPLKEICRQYGVESESKASNMIVTVKRRYRKALWQRLRDHTRSDSEANAEFREILRFLSESGARLQALRGKNEGWACSVPEQQHQWSKEHVQDESSTSGLNRDKLAKLWKLAADVPEEPKQPDAEPDKAELLRGQLAESLPLEAGLARMLPDILAVVCEKFRPFTGCSLGALLLDPQTNVPVLETIKDQNKKQAGSAPAGPKQDVATAIYYAAIASALVHHEVRITKLSYESLKRSFEELARSDWLPSDMRQLFAEAQEGCLRHMKKPEK